MGNEKADYLTKLKVTAAELAELKETWEIAGGLSLRKQAILRAARMAGDILLCWDRCEFRPTVVDDTLSSGCCYRLRPDLELPPEPAKLEGNEPFPWNVGGVEVWCCPVFDRQVAGMTAMWFQLPRTTLSYAINEVANFKEFLGVMTADENGWPKDWVCESCRFIPERNMGFLLADFPDSPFHFVCFRFVCFRKD